MHSLITHENIEALGFLNWNRVDPLVETAFGRQDKAMMGVIFVIAQWVVLSKRFEMPRARESEMML